jgi:hypothetical protein
VLGPSDEIEATLTLSDLSRQAERFKLAERVLLDPLEELRADLNGPNFGFDLREQWQLGLGINGNNSYSQTIDHLVTDNTGSFLPKYGPKHEQLSNKLVSSAGGLERYAPKDVSFFIFIFSCVRFSPI